MALVSAYDSRTGELFPNRVPEAWIGHPKLGPFLTRDPIASAADLGDDDPTPEADTPADTEEE